MKVQKAIVCGSILIICVIGFGVFIGQIPLVNAVNNIIQTLIMFGTLYVIISAQKIAALDRRKERLKEQLEFYLPYINQIKAHSKNYTNFELYDKTFDKKNLQTNYFLYAEKDTQELLSQYFSGEVNSEVFDEIVPNMERDFKNLKKEYDKITRYNNIT